MNGGDQIDGNADAVGVSRDRGLKFAAAVGIFDEAEKLRFIRGLGGGGNVRTGGRARWGVGADLGCSERRAKESDTESR